MGRHLNLVLSAVVASLLVARAFSYAPSCQKSSSSVELICQNLDRNSISFLETSVHDARDCYALNLTNSVVSEFPADIFDDNIFSEFYGRNVTFNYFPFDCLQSLLPVTSTVVIEYSFFPAFHPDAIRLLPFAGTLTNLRLANNALATLPALAFDGFQSLRNLDLTSNQLTKLANDTFFGLGNLETLKLPFNFISTVESDAFTGLTQLTTLILTGNRLYTIPQGTFGLATLPNLVDFQLYDNPFVCNCDLNWLKQWLDRTSLLDISGATCVCPISAPFKDIDFCGWE